jgi:hypothetical protein
VGEKEIDGFVGESVLIAVGTTVTKYEQMEGQAAAVEMGGEASGLQQQHH